MKIETKQKITIFYAFVNIFIIKIEKFYAFAKMM